MIIIKIVLFLECIKEVLQTELYGTGCLTPHELTFLKKEQLVEYYSKEDVCKDKDEYARKTYRMNVAAWKIAKGAKGYNTCPGYFHNNFTFLAPKGKLLFFYKVAQKTEN